MFVDEVTIHVAAGDGGAGAEAFRREKGVPRGGPSGGRGGAGGDVILRADEGLGTLLDFRYKDRYEAERGEHGRGANKTGADGDDRVLRVPPGTIVSDAASGEWLGELLEDGDELTVARGGTGGRGNTSFKTATRQAPRISEPGGSGERRRIALELKLIADVGLVGRPNAGKSTLLTAISAATPEVAGYPFTTVAPSLGVAQLSGHRSFVIADIPGIIEGAHEGRGLGLRFLRHIERTRTLACLIPVDVEGPQGAYDLLREELRSYSPDLAERPHCVVRTKTDLLAPEEAPPPIHARDAWGEYAISAPARQGLSDLLEGFWDQVRETIERRAADESREEMWRP